MSRVIMLIPTGVNVGLTSISLGIIHAIRRSGIFLNVFSPIKQLSTGSDVLDKIITFPQKNFNFLSSNSLEIDYAKSLLSNNQQNLLIEKIIANYFSVCKNAEIVLVEGLTLTNKYQFSQFLNYEIAKALHAEIIFVMSQNSENIKQIREHIELTRNSFFGIRSINVAGIIINKLNAPIDVQYSNIFSSSEDFYRFSTKKIEKNELTKCFSNNNLYPILGVVPWNYDLVAIRAIDIAHYLNATIINQGKIHNRFIHSITFCTKNILHTLENLNTDSLLIISADCPDILIAVCLAVINGTKISAILLTDSSTIDIRINKVCKRAFETGLPVFIVNTNTWKTAINLQKFNPRMTINDYNRIKKIQEYIADYISTKWIKSLDKITNHKHYLSPPAFRYYLTEMARKAEKCIVLPEGSEPRTIKAASICAERGIAICILLGDPNEIRHVAFSSNIKLNKNITILNPKIIREKYIKRLIELRYRKGMTEDLAREYLEDNVVLGTLMLEQNEVDGLVSGAIHTTANTIRPSLQLIKTSPGNNLVSSIFFMLFPEKVYVYGDCAINPNPTAEQLSEIAIQSADSAIAFGIDPYVAMLSYSTGISGGGKDVEKVREATKLAKNKRPDLVIDGPLQYDAAVMTDVGKFKAPNSPVAGRATVFIFPDLNTGNTTYKAVQRSAGLISIGPMLQGIRKPVNDLSRGALVDDIVYTIAITAIQASKL